MNLSQSNTSLFKRLRFVLTETSHPGNIGAAARAMKTMGFSELILVNPRFTDALQHAEAIAFASGAIDVLQSARIVGSIAEALADCNFAIAVTSRLREFSPPVVTPRMLANRLASEPALDIALLFGNERYGLPNEAVEQCNLLVNIPANPSYASLNLAQAIQVLAYECRLAALGDILPVTDIGFKGERASAAQLEQMYEHFEQALTAIGFLDPANPKKLMPRLRRLFSRAEMEIEEVNIVRGIATQILRKKDPPKGF